MGGEYTPNFQSLKYFKRINYRAGAYWRQTYINVGGEPVRTLQEAKRRRDEMVEFEHHLWSY